MGTCSLGSALVEEICEMPLVLHGLQLALMGALCRMVLGYLRGTVVSSADDLPGSGYVHI